MKKLAEKAVVIGTGLIGGSLAAAARRAGALGHVVGVGRSRDNLEVALRAALVDEISHDVVTAVDGADMVVLAVPVDACVGLLETLATATSQACVITDVASVKLPVCARAGALGIAARFVGAHPIAGAAATGAAAADAELFRDRPVVLIPGAAPPVHARVRALWEAVGATVLEMEAAAHDAVVALTSHLPQMLVFCLSALAGRDHDGADVLALAGSGLDDTTRLAMSDHSMWSAIARLNREPLLVAMDAFSALWSDLRRAIDEGDEAALGRIMREARAFKERLSSR